MSDSVPHETSPPPSVPPPPRGARLPAEYYALPAADIRPLVPRGVRTGCGIASAVVIVLLFAAGAWLSGRGAGTFISWMLQLFQVQLAQIDTKELTAAQKTALDDELMALQRNVGEGRVAVTKGQGVLGALRSASTDQKLTRTEAEQIIRKAHQANATAAASPKTSP